MQERRDGELLGAIADVRHAFAEALRAGDAETASRAYSEGATLLAPSAELIRGRTAIESFWKAGIEAGVCEVDLDVMQVERQNGLAYEVGSYALRLDPLDGGSVVDRGLYLLVHERQPEGCWRWAVEMFNPKAPADRPSKGE
jgi:ketosteroid isomerase-like protein